MRQRTCSLSELLGFPYGRTSEGTVLYEGSREMKSYCNSEACEAAEVSPLSTGAQRVLNTKGAYDLALFSRVF